MYLMYLIYFNLVINYGSTQILKSESNDWVQTEIFNTITYIWIEITYWWVLHNLWLELSPPSVVYYSSSFTNGLPFNNNVTSNSDFYKVVAGAIVRLINFVVRLDW